VSAPKKESAGSEPDRARSIGESISTSALKSANGIQKRAAKDGFDWEDVLPVFGKVEEELAEVKAELEFPHVNQDKVKEELGDLLFAAVNLCRHLGVDPEHSLNDANRKFSQRYEKVCKLAMDSGQELRNISMLEKEALWVKAKKLCN
jgi:ATP diphosphatase